MVLDKTLTEVLGGKVTGLAVDVYRNRGQVVAVSFWDESGAPLAFFKATHDRDGLVRSALLANDDVPLYDERKSFHGQRLEAAVMAGERLISVSLADAAGAIQMLSTAAPEDSAEINYWPLSEALNEASASLDAGAVQDAASALQVISRDWLGRNVRFGKHDAARNVVEATEAFARDLLAGKDGVAEELKSYCARIGEQLPDFRIVLLDETRDWTDDGLVGRAGKIWSAYLYDANRSVHLAELTPSYELEYLYCTAEGELTEDDRETLQMHGGPEGGVIYVHCSEIDRIEWSRKHACGIFVDPNADSYRDLMESEIEYYRGNVVVDVPFALTDERAARTALTLVGLARDNTQDVTCLLNGLSPAARQELNAYQAGSSVEEALGTYLHGLRAQHELARTLSQANVTLESAQLAYLFHHELIEQFETVANVGEQYGQRTVADLFYLQTAILCSSEIDVWPQSSIMDVVDKLASAEKWLSHTKPCNKYGEPAPRQDVSDVEPVMRQETPGF